MVKLHPHTIQINIASPATTNSNGDFVPASSSSTVTFGRWEVSREKNAVVESAGGSQIAYTGIIYLPKGSESFPIGAKVQVWGDENKLVVEGVIKQFDKGQINRRIWL